jgi:hypothetical protein
MLIDITDYIYIFGIMLVFIINYNSIHKLIFITNEDKKDNNKDEIKDNKDEIVPVLKYEDKYLDQFNNFSSNDLFFSLENILLEDKKVEELIEICLNQKRKELDKLEEDKRQIIENLLLNDDEKNDDEKNDEDNSYRQLQQAITELKYFYPNTTEVRKEAHEIIKKLILDNLKNSFIFEYTPLGNVAMCYNNDKESFEYYSDHVIPYRFLETVSRKYVITFHCKFLYVDMKEEIKNAQLKVKQNEIDSNNKKIETTKDMFSNIKNTNTNTNTNKNTNMNNNNNNNNNRNRNNSNFKQNSNINSNSNRNISNDIKVNANRYTHNGKFVNLILLKKIDKKVVDKNSTLSYKDFLLNKK